MPDLWVVGVTTVGSCLETGLGLSYLCSLSSFALVIVHTHFVPAVLILLLLLFVGDPRCLRAQPKFHCTHPTGLLCNAKAAKILASSSFVAPGRYVGKAAQHSLGTGTWHTLPSSFHYTSLGLRQFCFRCSYIHFSVFAIEFCLPEQQRNAAAGILYPGFHTSSSMSY